MPLPTPNDNESQSDFMARCMPVVTEDDRYTSQDQRVAVCMSQYRQGTKGIKVLDEEKGLLGGWGIPFGGPVKDKEHPEGKDLDGEYFDVDTNFCFEWFPNEGRPVLYDHGTDKDVQLTPVGKQVSKSVDAKLGVWVETQLDMANQYAKYILELAKKGVLAYSSGALSGYVRRERSGKITQWPYIEQTVTVRPANPYALIAADAVKHLKEADALPPELAALALPEEPTPANLVDAIKAALEKPADPPPPTYKKLTLPDGMSFTDFRTEVEEAAKELPGVESGWFVDAKDDTVILCMGGDDYYSCKFAIATDGDVTLDAATLAEVEQVMTWESEPQQKAGRTMSARNMGQMHQSMKALMDLHGSTCDMGADCPMGGEAPTKGSSPVEPGEEERRQEIDEILAGIELQRSRYV